MNARRSVLLAIALLAGLVSAVLFASTVIPTFMEQPGTQPVQANLESPDKCDNCHGAYDRSVEPAFNSRGSMMANATRDPIFWAALAVAEQDFVANTTAWSNLMPGTTPETGGAGDLCLRCHTPDGWLAVPRRRTDRRWRAATSTG
ncbi:MAG: hypothetical protein HY510_01065 [Acidobacteria bacterium]|nr:hypothetical protein [Acidobacteriota bacterium]